MKSLSRNAKSFPNLASVTRVNRIVNWYTWVHQVLVFFLFFIISSNSNIKNKMDIVKQELNEDRHVEVIDGLKIVYSVDKRRWENEEDKM
ncbi:hypothetical protein KQI41_12245 [Tissierella pigra]|uniref:hypothetical protein n=1 Tax=Tissierella pigra TaxID=2607614 RepID=UPI001C118485|nr:hypothetical protein [Tissierella pigra]MBU5427187.1 hypothetical protein [Tissierella pigra]